MSLLDYVYQKLVDIARDGMKNTGKKEEKKESKEFKKESLDPLEEDK